LTFALILPGLSWEISRVCYSKIRCKSFKHITKLWHMCTLEMTPTGFELSLSFFHLPTFHPSSVSVPDNRDVAVRRLSTWTSMWYCTYGAGWRLGIILLQRWCSYRAILCL